MVPHCIVYVRSVLTNIKKAARDRFTGHYIRNAKMLSPTTTLQRSSSPDFPMRSSRSWVAAPRRLLGQLLIHLHTCQTCVQEAWRSRAAPIFRE